VLEGALPQTLVEDLRLVISELVTNSVLHAGLKTGDPIGLTVDVSAERVRVEVVDWGTRAPRPMEPVDEHGRGLAIVQQVADRWGTGWNSEAGVVWAELDVA